MSVLPFSGTEPPLGNDRSAEEAGQAGDGRSAENDRLAEGDPSTREDRKAENDRPAGDDVSSDPTVDDFLAAAAAWHKIAAKLRKEMAQSLEVSEPYYDDIRGRQNAARERAAKLEEEAAELAVKDNDAYFGLPPILENEDLSAYQEFLKQVSECLKPENVLEMMWVRDVVDLQWDIDRMRRIKAALIDLGRREALEAIREPLKTASVLGPEREDERYDFNNPQDVLEYNLFGEDKGFVETIHKLLKITYHKDLAWQFNDKALLAAGVVRYVNQIARVSRMITTMETRRDKAVRELDRRRAGLAARTRRALAEVENVVQVEEIPAIQKKAA